MTKDITPLTLYLRPSNVSTDVLIKRLTIVNEAGARSGSAAGKAEVHMHNTNDPKCRDLGWICILLAVETYDCWVVEPQGSISCLAACLALHLQCSKSRPLQVSMRGLTSP